MNVAELIAALQDMPPDAQVWHLWDGEARTCIRHVWLSRGGDVITADHDMVCYSTETRPSDAPTEEENFNWSTPRAQEVRR